MNRYVIGLVTLDLVLRVILARVVDITLVVHVRRMYPHDAAAYPAGFRVPAHVIVDCERSSHNDLFKHARSSLPFALLLHALSVLLHFITATTHRGTGRLKFDHFGPSVSACSTTLA
jgi:hypothetical protein